MTPDEKRRARKLAAAKKFLGDRLATHPSSTFLYRDSSGAMRSPKPRRKLKYCGNHTGAAWSNHYRDVMAGET